MNPNGTGVSFAGTFMEELTKKCSETAVDLAFDIIKQAGRAAKEEVKVRRAMNQYVERYLARHGQVNVLGMGSPVPLFQIYTDINIVSPDFLRTMSSVDEMELAFASRGSRGFGQHASETRSAAIDSINSFQLLNVLGQPGAGKSTFLKRVGLEALLPKSRWLESLSQEWSERYAFPESIRRFWRYRHDCLPVMLELRRFAGEPIDLRLLITNELSVCGFENAGAFVADALKQGRFLILLDGLDEIPADRLDKSIRHISDFVDEHAYGGAKPLWEMTDAERKKLRRSGIRPPTANRFVTSCRTAFYKSYFTRFKDVVIADFDQGQIKEFVTRWFSDVPEGSARATAFMEVLSNADHRATLELARTPLLLTFLCIVYRDINKFPANRSHLYRRALYILLEKWAAEKRVHNNPIYKDLHSEFEVQMLARLAGNKYSQNRLFYNRAELLDEISKFLQQELMAPPHLNAAQVLDAIEIQQGLLVQRAEDIYSFSHLTVQEYLTAEYYNEKDLLSPLVSSYLRSSRWREVFLLLAGLLRSADDLLVRMSQQTAMELRRNTRIVALISWVEKNTRAVFKGTGPVERAGTLWYLLNREVDLEGGKPNDLVIARCRGHVQRILGALRTAGAERTFSMRGLGIEIDRYTHDLDLRKTTLEDLEVLGDYLRKCELIIDCKNAALSVSKECWMGVGGGLITTEGKP